MPSEQHYYSITLFQTHPKDIRAGPWIKVPTFSNGADTIISFRLCKVLGHSWVEAPDATVFDDPEFVAQTAFSVRLSAVRRSSNRRYYTEMIVEHLSSIGIPLHEQDMIIERVFYRAEVATPGKPIIVVCIRDVTLRLLDSESNLGRGDVTIPLWRNGRYTDLRPYQDQLRFGWFGRQPVCSGLPKPIPATKSMIEGLKKVRVEDLDDAVRKMPCSVCMEALDHVVTAEEGTDHEHLIAPLPCSHIYHGDCIIPWLKTNYVCPLCRLPVGKPPKPPLRLHWPMLMISAVGMMTATIIPRLFSRS